MERQAMKMLRLVRRLLGRQEPSINKEEAREIAILHAATEGVEYYLPVSVTESLSLFRVYLQPKHKGGPVVEVSLDGEVNKMWVGIR